MPSKEKTLAFASFDGVEQSGLVRLYTQTPAAMRLNSVVLGDGGVATVDFTKATDAVVLLEATASFSEWIEVGRNDQPAGTYQMQDPDAAGVSARFYRLRLE